MHENLNPYFVRNKIVPMFMIASGYCFSYEIISVSISSSSSKSLSSMSIDSESQSSTSVFMHSLQAHPGPQSLFDLLHVHCIVRHLDFLHAQPFVRNSMVLLTLAATSLESQSYLYLPSSTLTQPLSSGAGSPSYCLLLIAFCQNWLTQQTCTLPVAVKCT